MASVWFDSRHPPPACGNCASQLGLAVVREALVFDTASDIPVALKDGSVNLAICPGCSYHAWVWSGFLAVDRGARRAVFCVADLDAPGQDELLAQRWSRIAATLTTDEQTVLQGRTVWVKDYREIYQVLCEDDSTFELDARTDAPYRRRRRLADPDARARQFVVDFLEAEGAILRASEASRSFVTALRGAIAQQLDGCADAQVRQRLADFLAGLERIPPQALTADEGRRRGGRGAPAATEGAAPDDVREFDSSRSPQLSAAIARFARLPPEAAAPVPPATADTGLLQGYLEARRWLAGGPEPAGITGAQELLDQLVRTAPAVRVSDGERDTALSNYLPGAAWHDNRVVTMLCEIAFEHLTSHAPFAAALTRCLARAWHDTGSHHARFGAAALCGDYFAARQMQAHGLASLAEACLAFDTEEPLTISLPRAAYRLYAICWQRMGDGLADLGDVATALLCMAHAAKLFEQIGDAEGMLRSRLFAVSLRKESPQRVRSADVAQLLAEIVRAQGAVDGGRTRKVLQGLELECLVALAEAQFAEWRGPPTILAMRVGPAEAEPAQRPGRPETVLFRFEDADAATDEADGPEDDEAGEARPRRHGTALLTEVCLDGRNAYVAGARVFGIAWLRTLRRALAIAAASGNAAWWHAAYERIIELSGAIHPSLTMYFHRLLDIEAREAGVGPIPPRHVVPMHVALARSHFELVRKGESSELNQRGFDELLDVLEGEAMTPSFMARRARLQGLAAGAPAASSSDEVTQRVLAGSLLAIAELLEAGGRFEAAIDRCQAYLAHCEHGIRDARDAVAKKALLRRRTVALYRIARSALKHYRATQDEQFLALGLDAIEAYRVQLGAAGIAAPRPADEPVAASSEPLRSLRVHELREHLPANCHVVVFALLQETDINDGFWFAALISADGRIRFPRFIDFEQVHEPTRAVVSAFNEARDRLVGATPASVPGAGAEPDHALLLALDRAGEALFTPEMIGFLEGEQAERLLLVPESYLFDLPFPAIRIGDEGHKRFLFRLNRARGTMISVAPNLTHFRPDPSFRTMRLRPARKAALAVTLSATPTWRSDLSPLYGVTARLTQLLASHSPAPLDAPARTVHQFLDSLAASGIAVFFGHGEIEDAQGSILIADDGVVSRLEVEARLETARFDAKLLILCACSGIGAKLRPENLNKHLTGVHISMLSGGVRCVVGSLVPTFPICGILLLESLFAAQAEDASCDRKLLATYEAFAAHDRLGSPVFWGHLVAFGDAFFNFHDALRVPP